MDKKEIKLYNIDQLSVFKHQDILISRFAPYLSIHPNLHLAHKHSFYHLLLFTKGGGTHEIDFSTFAVKPYQIYFMIPGQVHSWNFAGHTDGYVVNFSPAFLVAAMKPDYLDRFPFFSGTLAEAVIDLPEQSQPAVRQFFEILLQESETGQAYGLDMVRAILLQLFITVARFSQPGKQNALTTRNATLLHIFKTLIEKHFENLRLPKEYADRMNITPNYLNALCRDGLGIPAGQVIRDRIVLEAKRLLVNLDLSVSEIGYKLNFEDNSYFTKFFKKQAGITPEDFRNNALKQAGTSPGDLS